MSIVSIKPTITRKEIESVLDCLINIELLKGNTVKNFEECISILVGMKYTLATNSLFSAYHLTFKALNIGIGDEVIIPSYFDLAPLSALSLTGGDAILVDIDEGGVIPSIKEIERKITEKTKAIVIGHTFGFYANIEEIQMLNIPIIEDISHIFGAENDEFPIGDSGTITVASFSPGCMITTGNGGIALTNKQRYYSAMRNMRDMSENTGDNSNISYDCCLTDFQGAMGISQLTRLQDFIERRRDIARQYYDAMKVTPHKLLYNYSDSFLFQSFPIIFDVPSDKVERYWKKNNIEVFKPISKPLHKYLGLESRDYPNSERLSKKLYSLPIYPTLTRKEVEKISRTAARFI